MSDAFNLSQLTQEIIVSRLKDAPDAPLQAARIAEESIVAAVGGTKASGQSPQETVASVCEGAMKGLLLLEKDVPQGALELLRLIAEAAQRLHVDPSELMTWAMAGIARITPLLTPGVQWRIREVIEQEWHGTGEIFSDLCEKAGREARSRSS